MSLFYNSDYAPKSREETEVLEKEDSKRILKSFIATAGKFERLGEDELRPIMKAIQEETGLKGTNLWMPVRIALTGQSRGPELQKLVEYFGKDEVLLRVSNALGN